MANSTIKAMERIAEVTAGCMSIRLMHALRRSAESTTATLPTPSGQ